MKMNKVLVAGIMAAVGSVPAGSTLCNDGGFYVGANLGASFNKASVKYDKDQFIKKGTKLYDDLVGKMTALLTKAKATWDKEKMQEHSEAIRNAIAAILADLLSNTGQVGVLCLQHDYEAVGTANAGSLAAILAKKDTTSILGRLITLLCSGDESIASDDLFKAAPQAVADYSTIKGKLNKLLEKSVTKLIQEDGKLEEFYNIMGSNVAAGVSFYSVSATTATALTTPALPIGPGPILTPTDANMDLFANQANTSGVYISAKEPNKAYVAELNKVGELIGTYREAVSEQFKSDNDLKAIFYKTGPDKKVTDTLITDVSKIKENMTAYNEKVVKKGLSDLGISDTKSVASKRATGFLFEALFGFDHRINDVMLGIDLNVGMECGGKAKIKDKKASEGVEVKRQFVVALMPRVGYLVAPQFEVFLTGGISIGRYKADTSKILKVFDFSNSFKKMGEEYNKLTTDDKEKINLEVWDNETKKTFKSHKKTKIVPVLGIGVSYEITPEVFARLAYNFAFKTKLVNTKAAGAEIKFASHMLKAGIGFRF
ncbi:MAG: hypothetical protein LBU35_02000 [Holosporales bacterium]|jgi:opacity protein-like surface antigen|nr:hypothetical protein [Holosporales bacterium]